MWRNCRTIFEKKSLFPFCKGIYNFPINIEWTTSLLEAHVLLTAVSITTLLYYLRKKNIHFTLSLCRSYKLIFEKISPALFVQHFMMLLSVRAFTTARFLLLVYGLMRRPREMQPEPILDKVWWSVLRWSKRRQIRDICTRAFVFLMWMNDGRVVGMWSCFRGERFEG